jgi:hypothetical protein
MPISNVNVWAVRGLWTSNPDSDETSNDVSLTTDEKEGIWWSKAISPRERAVYVQIVATRW